MDGDRARRTSRLLAQDDQPLRRGIGQRSQEDCVHEREYRRVRADAESKRENRDRGESPGLPKASQRVLRILAHLVE